MDTYNSHSLTGLWELLIQPRGEEMENRNRNQRFLLRLLSYILVAVLASGITLLLFCQNTKLKKLQNIITQRFVGEVNEEALEDAAAAAMVNALSDRWSYYVSASQYASYYEGKSNSYVGVGITVMLREDGQGFDIIRIEPGGPAQIAGILPGDILLEADGQSIAGIGLETVSGIIKGEEGTAVTLAVLRDGEKLAFELTRQRIQVAVAEGKMLPDNVGYVKIVNFNVNCADHTIAEIDKLLEQGAERFIFDVRNNSGGYVTEMTEVLDYLLPEGLLFRSVSYNGDVTEYDSDAECIELPMAVLVNADSYSAAEFFAAAMSEYDWAVVVGVPTCGKSYYQNTFELGDGSAVGLSVGQYFTPKGVSLAEVGGLVPDVTVEVDEETAALIYAELAEPDQDPQLQAAIDVLKENG